MGAHLVLFWSYGSWFGCCWTALAQCRGFLFFTPSRSCLLQGMGFRWARSWEGTQQLPGAHQRCSIPWNITLSLKNKRGEEGLGGGRRSGWEIIFQGGCCLETDWVWVCIWEVVRNCICITSCLSTPRTLFLSQPVSLFTLLLFSPLFPQLECGSQQAAVWLLSCWPG